MKSSINHPKGPADFSQARWHKSSSSNPSGNCVEVAFADGLVAVRDSKDRAAGHLVFTPAEWAAFLDGVNQNEFNQPEVG